MLECWKRLFPIRQTHVQHGERLFARFGSFTIFFARFVFGMRIVAGPLAGVLRMPWKQFVGYNFLGAAVWVTVVSVAGYLFGRQWQSLLRVMRGLNLGILAALAIVIVVIWQIRSRRHS
jgi:membrane-associated protein